MRLIIHDLTEDEFKRLDLCIEDHIIVSNHAPIRHCIGCFGCWVKTPGACVIRDDYGDMGQKMSQCDELLVISRCVYGGFSPFVKNIFDRSISYVHPFFTKRNHEMHHRLRYENKINYRVWFYGNTTREEQETAHKLIKANGINFDVASYKVDFYSSIETLPTQFNDKKTDMSKAVKNKGMGVATL
jgi:multimeric flavodoxin WrbA